MWVQGHHSQCGLACILLCTTDDSEGGVDDEELSFPVLAPLPYERAQWRIVGGVWPGEVTLNMYLCCQLVAMHDTQIALVKMQDMRKSVSRRLCIAKVAMRDACHEWHAWLTGNMQLCFACHRLMLHLIEHLSIVFIYQLAYSVSTLSGLSLATC